MKTINDYVKQAHETAKAKGWHDTARSALECHMLMVSEIAEASEEVRNKKAPMYFHEPMDGCFAKPEGEAVELIDCVIRIFDYFGRNGWDLEDILKTKMRYNETRSYRHGGKSL